MSHTTCRLPMSEVDLRSLGALLVNSGMIALAVIRHGQIVFATPRSTRYSGPASRWQASCLPTSSRILTMGSLPTRSARPNEAASRTSPPRQRGDEPVFDLALDLEPVDWSGEPAVLAFALDVTEQYRTRERLTYLAFADASGLLNRALFTDRLHQVMLGSRRHVMPFAVLMTDLDGFKGINATFGHAAGDAVLREVAQRFRGCIRDTDTLARLGGDEFAIILPQTDTAAGCGSGRTAADQDIGGANLLWRSVIVGTSIGIAVYPEHVRSGDLLLRAADTAMYRAKRMGRNTFQWAGSEGDAEPPPDTPQSWIAAHGVGIREIDEQHAHLPA